MAAQQKKHRIFKRQLIEDTAKLTGTSKTEVRLIVDTFIDLMSKSILQQTPILLKGFGKITTNTKRHFGYRTRYPVLKAHRSLKVQLMGGIKGN